MHNSEYPASVFSILDNGQKQIPLITDLIFDLLMLKVSPTYQSKKLLKVSLPFSHQIQDLTQYFSF
jgi:mediator of RNA polymerase II transcription subunit 20